MRAASRLCAALKSARYLEPNSPTGLTGLFNHPAPRSTLIYIYSSTLDKLKAFPESSVYRQSTEALTRHRLSIIESFKPAAYDKWAARAKKLIEEYPEAFGDLPSGKAHLEKGHVQSTSDGKTFIRTSLVQELDERVEEWDGEKDEGPVLEGTRSAKDRSDMGSLGREPPATQGKEILWEPEPMLEASQIAEIENQIGAGLIEEVIQVAEGELKLVDVMAESKVWEELEEKPGDDQWKYHERGTNTGKT